MAARAYGADLASAHHEGFGQLARGALGVVVDAVPGQPDGLPTRLIVDLGSGSGILARLLTDAGFDVLGVDISPDMVALAEQVAPRATFVCASLHDIDIPPCVAVTAIGEILNYGFDPRQGRDRLGEVFGRVAAALVPGGAFVFDVAGPGRGGPARGYTALHDDREHTLLTRAREDDAGTTLVRDITLFRLVGDAYRRTDERHLLHLYEPDEVEGALGTAGFAVRRVDRYGDTVLPPGLTGFVATVPAR